jgi:hypothetical protein
MASVTHDVVHEAEADEARAAQPYMNPYLAGIGLGLVLLAAFVLVGRGLGASGAFNSTIAWLGSLVAPGYVKSNEFLAPYLEEGTHPLKAWLVFEVVGAFVGALVSGLLAGRVGFGAAFGRGCTSGQALTGGALLNLGSWAFMMCVFGGAYAVAWFFRRQWR